MADGAIGKLVAEQKRTGADVVEMGTVRVWGPFRKVGGIGLPPQVIRQPELFEEHYMAFLGSNSISVSLWGKLYRTEVLAGAGLFPTGFKMGEDLMFNLRLFPHLKSYAIIDYPGYYYRLGGVTSRFNPAFWPNWRAQYFIKYEEAQKYGYIKGLRYLAYEIKNIFIGSIADRLIYKIGSIDNIKDWISEELSDGELWRQAADIARESPGSIYESIVRKDVEAVLEAARERVRKTRLRRLIMRVAGVFIH